MHILLSEREAAAVLKKAEEAGIKPEQAVVHWMRMGQAVEVGAAMPSLPAVSKVPPSNDLLLHLAWGRTAAQAERNAAYYRQLVVRCGLALGEAAYISDDGSRQEDVICAKVPELVGAMAANIAFIRSVLSLGDDSQDVGNVWESIWWRTDGEYGPVTFFVNCNDLFWWGTSDAQKITPENFPLLPQCVVDVREARGLTEKQDPCKGTGWGDRHHCGNLGALLFCCRVRKMRPQSKYFKYIPEAALPLFLACGPERRPEEEG